ncbi:hypothetical protein EB796_011471 [Bugula neritina]|uniref:Uncharacterized protein n=1 Tax=Bugula neritina TaxID=10212 RepID=A0A7J7JX26_BUGNE|nr:hypothetical protein EB796_011471 [Bugula neritina]
MVIVLDIYVTIEPRKLMNDLYVTYYPTVNITYKPLHIYNSKFLLQYSTVGQRSRARVVCSMIWNIPVSSPTLKSHPTSLVIR